jgi:hypothetical protein
LDSILDEEEKMTTPPTYCKGCSFKCAASDCDCECHDKIREYWKKERLRK